MTDEQNTEILVPQDEAIITAEPKVEAAVEKAADPDMETLQKRLAEAESKADAAEKRALEESTARQSAEAKTGQSVTSVLEARKAEAASLRSAHQTAFETAQAKMASSMELGQFTEAAKAQADMNTAQLNLDKVDTYKRQLDQFEAQQVEQAKQPQQPQISAKTKSWIDAHPEFNTDKVFQAECIAAHNVAVARGIRPDTDEYFRFVEQRAGLEPRDDNEAEAKTQRREPTSNAAPVSRSAPQNNGRPQNDSRVTLTPADREMAEMINRDEIDSGKMTKEDAWKKYGARKLQLQRDGIIGKAH